MNHSTTDTHDIRPLRQFFETTQLAEPQLHEHLAIVPLLLETGFTGPLPFIPLAQALAAGSFAVDEVSSGGSVPVIRALNTGDAAVLVVFGEELVGAKQNRIANASFLVPKRSEVVLDVSCVEAGRWSRRKRERFHASSDVVSSQLRKKMAHSVKDARERGGRFRADQREVWDEVGVRMQRSQVHSPTTAYADYREKWAAQVDGASRAFGSLERQVGFVALRPGRGQHPARVLGLEAIGRPDVFAKQFPALLRSYVVDAVDAGLREAADREHAGIPGAAHFEKPEPFLEALCMADFRLGESLGTGQDLRLDGDRVSGCALLHGGVIHLTAFPFETQRRGRRE